MKAKNQKPIKPAFTLKGSVLTLSVIQLHSFDYSAFAQQLEEVVKNNPNFFHHMPVLIDLQKLYSSDQPIVFEEITSHLRQHLLVPVGIINANSKQIEQAIAVGLGILPNSKTTQAPAPTKKIEQPKVITQPVRSGQQVYAKNCDLIIWSSVSNGAEVLADGNIHVYGTLRGRAIAGATGDTTARIFCHKLEAELVSIAGIYKLQEDMGEIDNTFGTQVMLDDNQLVITSVTTN